MEKPRIGIIGLGKMGSAIASRLSRQGFSLSGWNRSFLPKEKEVFLNIQIEASISALSRSAEIIILSLSDDNAVVEVLGNLCANNLENKLIVDTSTVRHTTLSDNYEIIRRSGADAIDAPISGWPKMIENGTAGIYIGGDKRLVQRYRPVAEVLSNRVEHVGKLGSGAAAKIVNNMMLASYWQSLKEAIQVGIKAGLQAENILTILSRSPAANGSLALKSDAILGRANNVTFTISGIVEDLRMFNETVKSLKVQAPAMQAAFKSFHECKEAGHGDSDFISMISAAIREIEGLE
ncbi:MAG: NAD(P)-dependent oxidoreductase [Paracoccaceae bacterium]|nr:NAD(P)-dependent oxidoreductase [Paracoccaceae bacterium]